MEEEDDENPNQFLNTIEAFIREGMDEHPKPKNGSQNAKSPKANQYEQSD
jgi:hypothetical protein